MDTEIILEEDDKKREKSDIPLYVTAVFIAVSGIGLLIFSIYYIAFLPVPNAMQPLRVRVLTTLQLEGVLEDEEDMVTIEGDEGFVDILNSPDPDGEVVAEAERGGFYLKLNRSGDWVEIRDDGDTFRGWVRESEISRLQE